MTIIRQSVRIALHALAANKLRAALTMLGIIIGVGAVTALLSIGEGAQAEILSDIEGIGSNLIYVTPGSLSMGTAWNRSAGSDVLTLEDAQAIAKPGNCPNCSAVAPQLDHSGEVVYRDASLYTTITGATPEFLSVRNFAIDKGQFFSEQEVAAAARVAAIGADAAESLFGPEEALGRIVRVNRVPFRIIAVFKKRGGVGLGDTRDRGLVIPLNTAAYLFRRDTSLGTRPNTITSINVSAVDATRIDQAIEDITRVLRERHHIQYEQDDFSVTSLKDIKELTSSVAKILTVLLAAVAAISLLVGGIGIMNIMLVSVMERTREIGLRKAVGARRQDILGQFLIEAVILSLAGGVVGILFGFLVSGIVNLTGEFQVQISLGSVLLSAGFSAAVGLFFGIFPAQRAARLNPIDALRYE